MNKSTLANLIFLLIIGIIGLGVSNPKIEKMDNSLFGEYICDTPVRGYSNIWEGSVGILNTAANHIHGFHKTVMKYYVRLTPLDWSEDNKYKMLLLMISVCTLGCYGVCLQEKVHRGDQILGNILLCIAMWPIFYVLIFFMYGLLALLIHLILIVIWLFPTICAALIYGTIFALSNIVYNGSGIIAFFLLITIIPLVMWKMNAVK